MNIEIAIRGTVSGKFIPTVWRRAALLFIVLLSVHLRLYAQGGDASAHLSTDREQLLVGDQARVVLQVLARSCYEHSHLAANTG